MQSSRCVRSSMETKNGPVVDHDEDILSMGSDELRRYLKRVLGENERQHNKLWKMVEELVKYNQDQNGKEKPYTQSETNEVIDKCLAFYTQRVQKLSEDFKVVENQVDGLSNVYEKLFKELKAKKDGIVERFVNRFVRVVEALTGN
jgi:leucyl-tRNA synthetase